MVVAGWQEVEVNIFAGLAYRAAFPSVSSPAMGRRTTTSQMTHAQNGTILKSSRRRARSLLFRPLRCLSRPCRTQFNDRFHEDPGCYDAATLPEGAPKPAANQVIVREPDPGITRPPSASSSVRSLAPQSVSSRQIHAVYLYLLFRWPSSHVES